MALASLVHQLLKMGALRVYDMLRPLLQWHLPEKALARFSVKKQPVVSATAIGEDDQTGYGGFTTYLIIRSHVYRGNGSAVQSLKLHGHRSLKGEYRKSCLCSTSLARTRARSRGEQTELVCSDNRN